MCLYSLCGKIPRPLYPSEHYGICACIVVAGDGRLGYPDDAPYDAIHVGAAAATIPQPVSSDLYPSIGCLLLECIINLLCTLP